MGLFSINEKADLTGRHLRDQQEAAQVEAVRRNAKKIGLSKRETEKRIGKVRSRFR